MTDAADKYHSVPVASFHVGQQLPFDVYESNDVLLLCKGSVITPRFLSNLRQRLLPHVFIRKDDLKQLFPEPTLSREGVRVDLETDVTKELDRRALDDAVAEGRALLERFRERQCKPYDADLVRNLAKARDDDVTAVSRQLTQLVAGANEIACEQIDAIANRYIFYMIEDLDATVHISQTSRKGDYIAQHSLQMSMLGMALAAEAGWPEPDVRMTGVAALLHDIGMAKVPVELRESPRPLNAVEFLEITKHPIYTLDVIDRIRGFPDRCRVVLYQIHERCDGNGYPRRRTAERIHRTAKLLGMVDAYLAMISERPYRPALLPYHAMEQIVRDTRKGAWDPRMTRSLLSLVGLFPVGSYVMLSDDRMAKVVRAGGIDFGRPQITITHNADGIPQKSDSVIDLAAPEFDKLSIVRALPPLFDFHEV
jgi:HD-GYP domain-containing protein (c-di-GMP phosphodiesterase class II)